MPPPYQNRNTSLKSTLISRRSSLTYFPDYLGLQGDLSSCECVCVCVCVWVRGPGRNRAHAPAVQSRPGLYANWGQNKKNSWRGPNVDRAQGTRLHFSFLCVCMWPCASGVISTKYMCLFLNRTEFKHRPVPQKGPNMLYLGNYL